MKPYRDLNTAYQNRFGKKAAKISIDAGFTCPTRDGTLDTRGCIFCSAAGSGEFAAKGTDILSQIQIGKAQTAKKWQGQCYIAYFQAFTNTYAPVSHLRQLYETALSCPDIAGIAIATRPDCLGEDVIALLAELNQKTALWIELGLQTAKESTAAFLRRGYSNHVFEIAVKTLAEHHIETVVHTILGLPQETREDVLATIAYLNGLPIQGIKLQLLHILKGTDLAQYYTNGHYQPLSQEVYTDLVCDCIEHLRPDIIIHRLTGDGKQADVLAPLWSLQKRNVLNTLHKRMKERNTYQGKAYSP